MQARRSPARRDAGGGSRCKGGAARRTAKRKLATGGGELEAGRRVSGAGGSSLIICSRFGAYHKLSDVGRVMNGKR